ncbi:hypothetical protein L6452_00701 [Arctium lappa]|uniref:Uncharacterized protein n=1 Tax=Arctium lappa TaxID=4217 RepID=A0ACB9FEK8_ARCLA|nr:hypothetical protein L6452_00701 [Arctium lappa]
MASRTFLLLALAFAVVLLVTSEVAAAKDLASNPDSEIDGRGGYNKGGGGGGYNNGGGGHGGYNNGGGHGGYNNGGGRGGYNNGGGHGGRGGGYNRCRHGCCGGRYHGGCKCCSSFAEATAYKQTQN